MGKQRKNTDKTKELSKEKRVGTKQNSDVNRINDNICYDNDNNELSDFDIVLKKIISNRF